MSFIRNRLQPKNITLALLLRCRLHNLYDEQILANTTKGLLGKTILVTIWLNYLNHKMLEIEETSKIRSTFSLFR